MQSPETPSAFSSLAELLAQELRASGLKPPGAVPESAAAFTPWYLASVQLLEGFAAGAGERQPMTRGEVELMCRAALTGIDLADSIHQVQCFCRMLHPRAGSLACEQRDNSVLLRQDSNREVTTGASSLVDITGLFAFSQLFQWLVGRDLPLRQVTIGPIQREDVLPFLKLFRAPVLSGGEGYSLELDAGVLSWPNVRSAAEFPGFFTHFPCSLFERGEGQLQRQVSALLAAAGRRGEGLPTQAGLAKTLGMSLSALRRKLAQQDCGYRQLKQNCQRELALQLLRGGDLSIAQVAQQLGYSDVGSFRRAVHNWYGVAPGDLRSGDAGQ